MTNRFEKREVVEWIKLAISVNMAKLWKEEPWDKVCKICWNECKLQSVTEIEGVRSICEIKRRVEILKITDALIFLICIYLCIYV